MALENLEKKLHARARAAAKRLPRRERPRRPAETEEKEHLPQWLKRLMIWGGVATLLIVVVGLFLVFFYTSGSRDVTLTVNLPATVVRGEPFNVEVQIVNNTGSQIKNGAIEIDLPDGLVNYGGANPNMLTDQVGDIGVGSLSDKTYSLLPVGPAGESETLAAAFNYAGAGGTQFSAHQTAETSVAGEAMAVQVTPPAQILAGSSFSLPVTYVNNSDFAFPAMTLSANYPAGFTFDSSDVPPESLNNYWQLGSLAPHASGTLTIMGHLSSGATGGAVLPITLSASFDGEDYPLAQTSVPLSPSPAPVSLTVLVNGANAYVAHVGDTLNYSIGYQNVSGVALSDVTIKATIVGSLVDLGSVQTSGTFNASTQTVTWNQSNDASLALVGPGNGGQVNVSVKLDGQSASSVSQSGKDHAAQISVVISSPTVPPYLSASRTTAQAIVTTKVAGLASVSATGLYRDAQSGIVNGGVMPPQVGQTTDFTIHWDITNYQSNLDNVTVSAALPQGVVWTGQAKSNVGSVPTYSSSTGIVTWNAGSVPAGGVAGGPAEAVFQVAATPSIALIGQYEPILNVTTPPK
ncbi:hypothetical protein M1432_00570 [Patescibacteria group bacterium]|nr:hypothetical protein [Patescibacteria group bacterium]